MAEWPTYARFTTNGAGEDFQPNVIRTEMERGVPKMRRVNTRPMVQISGEIIFLSEADIAAFDDWYFDTIGQVGWFDFRHPRTGQIVQARIVSIGTRAPVASRYSVAVQPVTLEYLR